MITASHNPPEFNGIKCIDSDGTEMPRSKEEEIERLYFTKSFRTMEWNGVGGMRPASGAVPEYLASVKRLAIWALAAISAILGRRWRKPCARSTPTG